MTEAKRLANEFKPRLNTQNIKMARFHFNMENSGIEWTHHTFNPWIGCVKVSAGCAHCYAETQAARFAARVPGQPATPGGGLWGAGADRRVTSDAYWRQPLRWNEAARVAGKRARVFCASMADVFEDRADLDAHRKRLWALIRLTPHLDWLLLTKRPENVRAMVPQQWVVPRRIFDEAIRHGDYTRPELRWPDNVWVGATVEDSATAFKRIEALSAVPAPVRFLSCEPMLGDVVPGLREAAALMVVHWIICGGESGAGARPLHPQWALNLLAFCRLYSIPFFFKQWGEFRPVFSEIEKMECDAERAEFTVALVRDLNGNVRYSTIRYERVGKKAAGRKLAGREWSEFPK